MSQQIQSDINDSTIEDSEIEDLDFDVKEAISTNSQWIDLDLKCKQVKTPADFTCLKIKT